MWSRLLKFLERPLKLGDLFGGVCLRVLDLDLLGSRLLALRSSSLLDVLVQLVEGLGIQRVHVQLDLLLATILSLDILSDQKKKRISSLCQNQTTTLPTAKKEEILEMTTYIAEVRHSTVNDLNNIGKLVAFKVVDAVAELFLLLKRDHGDVLLAAAATSTAAAVHRA